MRITVLGASGGIGQWVVQLATERGHTVRAVVREESEYQGPEGSAVVRGAVTSGAFVKSLELGDHVVLSCVGQRRASALPWSKLLSPPDLVQTVARNLTDAMPEKLVWVSAGGVGSSREQLTATTRKMVNVGKVGIAYADLEEAESVLEKAPFPTLAVRPVILTRGTKEQNVGAIDTFGFFSTVHRRSVAAWMLDYAEGQCPVDTPAVLLGQR